ncbi:MAG: hypothetical protein QM820_46760 [Minicystis sp.]
MLKDRLKYVRKGEWPGLVIGAAVLAGLVIGPTAIMAYNDVVIANGLPGPITVVIDGRRATLEGGSHQRKSLRKGVHDVEAIGPSGEALDQGLIDVPEGNVLSIYNPLGAAPVYKATIHYAASESGQREPDIEFLGGARFASPGHPNFLFEEPPRQISVKSHESPIRTVVDQAKGGHHTTINYLVDHGARLKAAEVARAVARMTPADETARDDANRSIERAKGLTAAVAFAREMAERRPDDFDAQREYQYYLRRADRGDEARAIYRARFEKDRTSVLNAGLYARVLPRAEAQGVIDELLRAHPDAPEGLFFAGWLAFSGGDYARADELFQKVAGDKRYDHYTDEHALALVALHRTPDAVALLARQLDKQGASPNVHMALLYAQIADRPDAGPVTTQPRAYVDKLVSAASEPAFKPWVMSLLGEETTGSLGAAKAGTNKANTMTAELEASTKIQLAAEKDPAQAWDLCAQAGPTAFRYLHPLIAVLLAGEFARAGDRALAERLLWDRPEIGSPPASLLAYVIEGVEHPDLWRLDLSMRAALDLARARALEARGEDASGLYKAVERGDLAVGVVTRARFAWPALRPAADPKKQGKKGARP